MVDVVLQNTWLLHHINKDEDYESLPLLACNFSEMFKRRQIILEPCTNSECPIRCLLWGGTLSGAIWKQGMSKVCKNNFQSHCVRCKANLHGICFEIFHGYWLMFDCATQGLKIYELDLFNNIFVQLFSSSSGSSFLVFPSGRLSITFDFQIDL